MNTQFHRALPWTACIPALLIAVLIFVWGCIIPNATAEVLVGNIFATEFEGWTDTYSGSPRVGNPPQWGVLLGFENQLIEVSDGREADSSENNDGLYTPYLMINTAASTPATYNITTQLATYDNDGFGMVFGYQDNDNYFRFGLRHQSTGNLGFPVGFSVQKVVGGEITQLEWDGGAFLPYIDGTPFDVQISVDGSDWNILLDGWYEMFGTDTDLQPGYYGIQSWAQLRNASADPRHGTVVYPITVSSTTLNQTTDWADAIPVAWRSLQMVNSDSAVATDGDSYGNFRQDFTDGTIQDDSNGYTWATTTTPNIDFLGPAMVINEPGSASWTNYQMKVRMENGDNDGIGLLVRVASDDTFYRVNFSREGLYAEPREHERAPSGMSIQKCDNGIWSELFRDDQGNPKFLFSEDVPFDVVVSVVDDTMQVKVINDPDGAATVYSYDPIVDPSFPILSGSVGLAQWGSGHVTNGITYSPFGGDGEVLLETITQIIDIQATLDRTTGNITIKNLYVDPADIQRCTILSPAGALNPTEWTPITDHYDEPLPGDGSVDSNDAWSIVTETNNELTEAELSGGDGGTIGVSQSVDFGDIWIKSRIEDVTLQLELTDGSIAYIPVNFTGASYERSDLNTDGSITSADWLLFYPNTLADMSSMSRVEQVLAGDLDGDGDNDVDDFSLFKADYEASNGVGSFDAMLASIPEPSSLILVVLGFVGVFTVQRWSRIIGRRSAWLASWIVALLLLPGMASAVDFTTFTVDTYPQQNTFPLAIWDVTPTTARILDPDANNAGANVFYGTQDILNTRIFGTLVAGTDDDIVGLALGYQPGDVSNLDADFILIDWKGVDQDFNFADVAGSGLFHDLTGSQFCPAGLAISRVSGIPTADELWGHVAIVDNPSGGVEELARGATLGSSRYPGNNPVNFDITYTDTEITVKVDDVEQFSVTGTFGSGRLGLYTLAQYPTPTFSNFDIIPLDQVLSATVDTTTGEIVLVNNSTVDVEFDFYQFDSAANSLNPTGWSSLDANDYDATGTDPGQSWDEAGGSDASALAEMYLQGSTILSGSESVSIGNAYNTAVDAQDLALQFRMLPYGFILQGTIEYVESPVQGADFDEDGDVDGNDFLAWQAGFGMTTGATHADGDADNNGAVNGADLVIWKSQFGSGGAGASGAAIPEPSCLWLIALALAGLICHHVGRRR